MEPVSAELDQDYYLCLVLVFILPYVFHDSDYVQVKRREYNFKNLPTTNDFILDNMCPSIKCYEVKVAEK